MLHGLFGEANQHSLIGGINTPQTTHQNGGIEKYMVPHGIPRVFRVARNISF